MIGNPQRVVPELLDPPCRVSDLRPTHRTRSELDPKVERWREGGAHSAPYGRAAPARSAVIARPSAAARSSPMSGAVASSTARPHGTASPPGGSDVSRCPTKHAYKAAATRSESVAI